MFGNKMQNSFKNNMRVPPLTYLRFH